MPEPSSQEIPWTRDFHDDRYETRRLFAEALGTYFLVLATLGVVAVNAKSPGSTSSAERAIVPGLVLIAVIYSIGSVSGAHVNPAVTFSYALRRNFPWRRVPGYWFAQLLGGVVAALTLRQLVRPDALGELSRPGAGVSSLSAFLIEAILTLGMVTVTLGTASGQNNVGPTPPSPVASTSRRPGSGPERSRAPR